MSRLSKKRNSHVRFRCSGLALRRTEGYRPSLHTHGFLFFKKLLNNRLIIIVTNTRVQLFLYFFLKLYFYYLAQFEIHVCLQHRRANMEKIINHHCFHYIIRSAVSRADILVQTAQRIEKGTVGLFGSINFAVLLFDRLFTPNLPIHLKITLIVQPR